MIYQKNKVITILFASVLMDFIGTGIIIPLLPFYAQVFGASPFKVGLLLGLHPLMRIFAPTFWGTLSDRIGHRFALLFNIAGTTLAYLLLSSATSLWMLFIARILGGLSSASMVIAQSYVLELTTTENRIKTLSLLQAVGRVGFVIGPAIAGFLVGSDPDHANFRLPGLAATAMSGITFCFAFFALPHLTRRKTLIKASPFPFSPNFFASANDTLQRPLISLLLLLVFIMFFALWCKHRFGWGSQQFSTLIIFYCAAMAIIHVSLIGRIARWLDEAKLLVLSISMFTLGLCLIPLSTTVPQFLGALLFLIFGQATGNPVLIGLLGQLSGVQQQGKTLGLKQSITGLANFFGSIWAGFLFGALGENWPYWSSAVLMSAITVFSLKQMKQSRLSEVMSARCLKKRVYLFELFDRDGSGNLELKDFQDVGQALAKLRGLQPGTKSYDYLQVAFSTGFEEMLKKFSHDKAVSISRSAWLASLEQRVDYDFGNFFLGIIDATQEGKVMLEDLKFFYQAYDLSIAGLEEVFQKLDLNQDGYLSSIELKEICDQFLHSHDVHAPGNWIFGECLIRQL